MTRQVGIEIFYWMKRWDGDQSSHFHKAKKSGFDGVEISLVAGLPLDLKELSNTAADYELELLCSTGLTPELDITSADDSCRRAGVDHLTRSLEVAAELGSPILGGVTYAPWMFFPEGDLEDRRQRAAQTLRSVGDRAAALGVDLCFEVLNRFESFMFNTVDDCVDFIDLVGSPAIKVEVDTFHMNIEEDDLAAAIRTAGDRLGHVQVAANNRRAPQYGHIDWEPVKAALDDIGYDRWIVFETFPDPNAQTGRSTHAWRNLTGDSDADAAGAAEFIREHLS